MMMMTMMVLWKPSNIRLCPKPGYATRFVLYTNSFSMMMMAVLIVHIISCGDERNQVAPDCV